MAASATISLDQYLSVCGTVAAEGGTIEDDVTYGMLSADMGVIIELMSSVTPPAEVADWHNKSLEITRVLKGLLDSQPADQVVGNEFFAIAAELEGLQEAVIQAENDLPAGVRQRMAENGCLEGDESMTEPEPTATPMPEPSIPTPIVLEAATPTPMSVSGDIHGDDISGATAIEVGEFVEWSMQSPVDVDFFPVQRGGGADLQQ